MMGPTDRRGLMLSVLALAALGVLVLNACGTAEGPMPTSTAAGASNGLQETPDGPPYYEGKTITIVVGWPAGSSSDVQARYLADALPKFIPGNPNINVTNMPGASGIIASNYVWKAAPDGLTILHGPGGTASAALERPDEVEYRHDEFVRVWSFDIPPVIWYALGEAPYPRLQDAIGGTQQFTIGSEVPAAEVAFLTDVLDLPLVERLGIPGSVAGVLLAFDRKDADTMRSQTAWYRLPQERPGWLSSGYIVPFAVSQDPSIAIQDNGEMALPDDVPNVRDFLTPEQVRDWNILTADEGVLFRNGMMPPGTPLDIRDTFANALAEAFQDPEFMDGLMRIMGRPVQLVLGEELDRAAQEVDIDRLDEVLCQYRDDYVSPRGTC